MTTIRNDDVVYVCNCPCHFPTGWRWRDGDPRPTNLKHCAQCWEVPHMPGEEAGVFAVPRSVRSIPVPLTVRRHTEQSKQIWFDNLYAAMPADMLAEDKARITDALLEMAITHSDLLRRRRLVDRLMQSAGELSNLSDAMDAVVDLMRDAAEEIRSIL